jgi:hypothetical protein
MLQVEQIHEWRGQEVRDQAGEKIGKLDEVFYDSASGEPRFISITSGLFGRRSYLVTLANASVGRDYVRVGYSASQVQAVEASETDGQLDPEALRAATESYGVPIVVDVRFESATLLAEREAEATRARERADELEQEAARRHQEAAERHDQAAEAARASAQAAQDRDDAMRVAASARADADQAAEGTAPPA